MVFRIVAVFAILLVSSFWNGSQVMGKSPGRSSLYEAVPGGPGRYGGRGIGSDSAVLVASGDIEAFLSASRHGEADDGRWLAVDPMESRAFSVAMRSLIAGDLDRAARAAVTIGFQVIEYTDPERGIFHVLRDMPDTEGISRGGTYVRNPRARYPVVIEVPHPVHEENTSVEGIRLFLQSSASLLSLAGTHRRSDGEATHCDGGSENGYRRSDPSHMVEHLFHIAHVQADLALHEPLFIQLHGFGDDAYEQLKAECGHVTSGDDPGLLVNVSEAVYDPANLDASVPGERSFARVLANRMNHEGSIRACLFSEDTTIYGGTQNTQGRYTNGSRDPCRTQATVNSGRFVHLEQSYNVRMNHADLVVSMLVHVIEAYFTGERSYVR